MSNSEKSNSEYYKKLNSKPTPSSESKETEQKNVKKEKTHVSEKPNTKAKNW